MKKLTIALLAIIFSAGAAFSQPVSDNGIIPIGITLNSIMRLNITNGGNIEYVINTMDQYTNGIPNSPRYTTSFTVASSVEFEIYLSTDANQFTGVDNEATPLTMDLDYMEYTLRYDGGGAADDYSFTPAVGTYTPLVQGPSRIIEGLTTGTNGTSAGDITKNIFSVLWSLGEGNNGGQTPLLGIPSDRYVVNVFLELQAHP